MSDLKRPPVERAFSSRQWASWRAMSIPFTLASGTVLIAVGLRLKNAL